MRVARRRSIEDTCRRIGDLVEAIQSSERANYFANAGGGSVNT